MKKTESAWSKAGQLWLGRVGRLVPPNFLVPQFISTGPCGWGGSAELAPSLLWLQHVALAGASLGALPFTPIYMAASLYGSLCHYINIVNCYKTRQNHWKMS